MLYYPSSTFLILSHLCRFAGMQFSFQNGDLKTRSSIKSETLLCTPDNDSNAQGGLDSKNLNIPETGLDLLSPDPQSPDTRDRSKWQLVPTEHLDKKLLGTPQTPANNSQVHYAFFRCQRRDVINLVLYLFIRMC